MNLESILEKIHQTTIPQGQKNDHGLWFSPLTEAFEILAKQGQSLWQGA